MRLVTSGIHTKHISSDLISNGTSFSEYKNNHPDLIMVVMKAQATDKSTTVLSRLEVHINTVILRGSLSFIAINK